MSILASLPAPTKHHLPFTAPVQPVPSLGTGLVPAGRHAPPYPRRLAAGFVPRKPEDFGDGGAFPELHVSQYPLDMGRGAAGAAGAPGGGGGAGSSKTLAVTINADGQLNYDAIVKQGANRDKVVYTDHKALVPKVDKLSKEALMRPDEEEVEATTKATAEALFKVVANKMAVTQTASLPAQPGAAVLIKYTPVQQGPQYASGAGQRIIRMQNMPIDPLEPPKFRHTKVPRGAGSPPVPVMHSPPRPVTVQDQANWKIPPCISNWKNPKGYTIPLDKRLAADGRGLQETTLNDKFAGLSEALYTAESKAREAINMRSQIQKEIATKEKERKERELRELALRARMERGGGIGARVDMGDMQLPGPPPMGGGGMDLPGPPPLAHGGGHGGDRGDRGDRGGDDQYAPPPPPPLHETPAERDERRRRDDIREERRRERERERRLESKEGGAHAGKKSKTTRDRDRDVGEKVALGMANVGAGGEVMYDQRLFNQDQGLTSGFGGEDSYTLYDKALFADRGSQLYKASKGGDRPDDEDGGGGAGGDAVRTDRFKADRGFKGAEGAGGGRAKPVEFERQAEEADPFGLDQFLTEVKGGKKKGNALDSIGQGGSMRAAGGGSTGDAGGSGRRMQFQAEGRG